VEAVDSAGGDGHRSVRLFHSRQRSVVVIDRRGDRDRRRRLEGGT
jgi:hypothetical protein